MAHAQAFCDPERLLAQQRTVAASLRTPVVVENRLLRFDDSALQRLESVLFEPVTNQSIELPQVTMIIYHKLLDHIGPFILSFRVSPFECAHGWQVCGRSRGGVVGWRGSSDWYSLWISHCFWGRYASHDCPLA